ncbi:hypothetical protein OG497_08635 [Streptomyces sp. NBC_01242]|uniref:hypothetical protein n=1 Tax=unclassified Streptomyces TaxID=2593676 RepID=UPI00225C178B|nr:hypothetical protein [Streptomyces sp. NBC_01242]MCX4794183.1 hypothetical protein [Streptomyces sp. NBC_01242]WSP58339.1 hypothetical protein OG306_31080 [Streptomyces sp. NBC_01241]
MDPLKDPLIRAWAGASGGDADYLDFLSRSAGQAEWIALSRVFLPQFVEVEGCVLWDRSYDPINFRLWRSKLNGDIASIEANLNQFRLWLYIDIDDDAESQANALALAQDIAGAWRLSLKQAFPQKIFDVQATGTVDGPVVSFTTGVGCTKAH